MADTAKKTGGPVRTVVALPGLYTGEMRMCTRCASEKALIPDNFRACNEIREGAPYRYVKRICRACEHRSRLVTRHKNIDAEQAVRRARDARLSPSDRRQNALKRHYGITMVEYDAMLLAQDNGCAICNMPEEEHRRGHVWQSFHIDHDHETGRIRGLLCSSCNLGLGKFQDNPEMLGRAALYLRERTS